MVATSAARAGVLNLVRSLATEFAPRGVRVNGILIGLVESGQWRRRFATASAPGETWEAWTAALAQARKSRSAASGAPKRRRTRSYSSRRRSPRTPPAATSTFQGDIPAMPSNPRMTVGELVAAFLESSGVHAAFGVISIHNMPILDAFGRRAAAASANGRPAPIRFVPARGEAGAVNMADAYARVSARARRRASPAPAPPPAMPPARMVEALTAGTPVLHLTGQIEAPYLDRELAYIHEAPDQLDMLRAVSKAAFRVRSAETALGTLREAVPRRADGAPRTGQRRDPDRHPVDARSTCQPRSRRWPIALPGPAARELDALAERLARATRPLLWLGGGARHAGASVTRLVDARLRRRDERAGPRHPSPRTTRSRSARSTCTSPSRSSTRPATRCWSSARACAATRR